MIDLTKYYKRTDYPDEGQVVGEMIYNEDNTITIVYDDYTFLVVKKVKPC